MTSHGMPKFALTIIAVFRSQLRGSVPLLWTTQPNIKYKSPLELSPAEAAAPGFERHFRQLVELYQVHA